MKISTPLALCAAIIAMPAIAAHPTPTSPAETAAAHDLKEFPAATSGQKRFVINLPAYDYEDTLKVQLFVGKTMTVDCNTHFLGGNLEERTAEGWGYNYYVQEDLGPVLSTQKGCPTGSERQAFVRSSAETLLAYNSRLPIVVYAPADAEVRYRLWRAGEEQTAR